MYSQTFLKSFSKPRELVDYGWNFYRFPRDVSRSFCRKHHKAPSSVSLIFLFDYSLERGLKNWQIINLYRLETIANTESGLEKVWHLILLRNRIKNKSSVLWVNDLIWSYCLIFDFINFKVQFILRILSMFTLWYLIFTI